jgi:hypothetical protein
VEQQAQRRIGPFVKAFYPTVRVAATPLPWNIVKVSDTHTHTQLDHTHTLILSYEALCRLLLIIFAQEVAAAIDNKAEIIALAAKYHRYRGPILEIREFLSGFKHVPVFLYAYRDEQFTVVFT